MSNIGDAFKNIFLAGIGAMAYTGEKGKEIIDQLVEKGEITLDQGKELNEELSRKAGEAAKGVRDSALEATMMTMSAEEREEFAAKAAEIAAMQNAAEAEEAAEAEAEAEAEVEAEIVAEEVVIEDVEEVAEAAEDAAEAAAETVEDAAEAAAKE